MPASELGPWGRIYFRVTVDKSHYSLEALGAFLKVWANMGLVTPRGRLKRRAIVGLIGADMYAFLVEEGDLIPDTDGESVAMHRWDWYQAPLTQNAARQRGSRERASEKGGRTVDSVTVPDSNVTVTSTSRDVPHSPSPSSESEDGATAESREGFDENDPLEAFYIVTTQYPNAPRLKSWIRDVARAAPAPRDFFVVLKGEFAAAHGDLPTAMHSTKAKLLQMADRAAAAKAKEPKRPSGLQADIAASIEKRYDEPPEPEATPEAIAAGRAAFEALRTTLPGRHEANGTKRRNGIAEPVAAVLGSVGGDRAAIVARQDVGTSDSPKPTRPVPPISGGAGAVRPAASRSPNTQRP